MRCPAAQFIATLVVVFSVLLTSHVVRADETSDFLAAREAFRVGNAGKLAQSASHLQNSILEPWVAYWQLSLHLGNATPTDINDFISHHGDSPLAARLRADWLRQLATQQDWGAFTASYTPHDAADLSLECDDWQAEYALHSTPTSPQAVALWQQGKPLPSPCNQYFDTLAANHLLDAEATWQRIQQAMFHGDTVSAELAANDLPPDTPITARQLEQAANRPEHLLALPRALPNRSDQELIRYALDQLAHRNAHVAYQRWQDWQLQFNEPLRSAIWADLATRASQQHLPEALSWFFHAHNLALDDTALAWKTRAALLASNWPIVQQSILAMQPATQAKPAWRYWLARSDRELGNRQAANLLLLPLSIEYSFYGLLAQEDLGAVASAPTTDVYPSSDEIAAVSKVPGIARALLLHQMGLRGEATLEWRWSSQNFTDRQLLAAAILARDARWLDCAINTADRTHEQHNLALSFLSPYHNIAHSYAEEFQLNEAWVYGLIRQESRFISYAHSGVGASGLMQVMPATGRWIARQLHIRHFQPTRLSEPDVSLHFGMYYLKTILKRLNNSDVLATAGYNAGPRRALEWQPAYPVEGAIYAETIPFGETRDYVKKVFANSVFYARRFNQPDTSLKARLGIINANHTPPCTEPEPGTEPGTTEAHNGTCGNIP